MEYTLLLRIYNIPNINTMGNKHIYLESPCSILLDDINNDSWEIQINGQIMEQQAFAAWISCRKNKHVTHFNTAATFIATLEH